MMDINVDLLHWFKEFQIINATVGRIKNEVISNKELAEGLHKPIKHLRKEKYTDV